MNRYTERTNNGIKVGGIEYTEPGVLLEALTLLADYEDMETTPDEFKKSVNYTLELNKRLRPFFDKYADGCGYRFNIPNIGVCCKAYSQSKRSDGKHWAHYPLCEGQNCPKLYPFKLEGAKLENVTE